ncbi:Arrestin domain-containing protein 4 [Apophysomyces sp. BC1034]|nr:Arrestin domain-containing protein 4 [Apophysomyces sp. BC1015]KAG0181755.1 Arrestin domain-containing protein 4 [Apophysomyces sp. BC1021]KAG0193922.1 Arrestin domain-containing protein 4 [Apophysomyces sp. BC1034]
MFLASRKQNDFYIKLDEDRFYYTGEVIRGNVVLDLAKPTKTNHVRIAFVGEVQSESTTIQLFSRILYLANPPDDEKSHILEAQTHSFPFEFTIPGNDGELPSSTQLPNLGSIKYLLSALHDKPYVPDSLSPQTKKEVSILEKIDVTLPEYCMKGNFNEQIQLVGSDDPRQVRVSMTLPKFGIVRGKLIFVSCIGQLSEKKVIKSNAVDINITGPLEFIQTSVVKILFPTSTPPTVGESGKIVSIEYWIRAEVNLNEISPDNSEPEHPKNIVYMEANVVVGTCPKPELAIDDEDEDDETVEHQLIEPMNQLNLDHETAEEEPPKPAEETTQQSTDRPSTEITKENDDVETVASAHSAAASHVDPQPSDQKSHHSKNSSISRNSVHSNTQSDPPVPAAPHQVPSPSPSFQEPKQHVAMPNAGDYLPQYPPAIPPKPVQNDASSFTERLDPYYQQPYHDYGNQGDAANYVPSFPIAMPMPQHQPSFSTSSLSTSPYLRPSPSPSFPMAGSPSGPAPFPMGYYSSPIMSERPSHGYGQPDGTPAPNNYWMPSAGNYHQPPQAPAYPPWS